ncbi:hypothetical protein HHX47_DHR2000736 [Lentinula edodes]|nr:hypothetical protein HHX47_DHR2000736 [Lentinula edodes]
MSGQKIEEHKSDVEKRGSIDLGQRGEEISALPSTYSSNSFTKRLLSWGVESRGISPVPSSQRTDTSYYKLFFIWFTMNFNILSFSAGTLGPVAYGLGIRESCLVILFFNALCCAPPAYFATWGPKLGMRQMVQARFSFGYYGVILVCILNLIVMTGFCILNAILGGQTLASVADGNLTWNAGIVIVVIISLALSFCGYSILTWYERIAWFPVLVVYLVALGLGGKYLNDIPASAPASTATAPTILSFASTIAGFYPPTHWNAPSLLPSGISAIAAGIISFGLVVPSMAQIWFTGPIAEKTGDIGFELAFVFAGVVYTCLRGVEVKWKGRL